MFFSQKRTLISAITFIGLLAFLGITIYFIARFRAETVTYQSPYKGSVIWTTDEDFNNFTLNQEEAEVREGSISLKPTLLTTGWIASDPFDPSGSTLKPAFNTSGIKRINDFLKAGQTAIRVAVASNNEDHSNSYFGAISGQMQVFWLTLELSNGQTINVSPTPVSIPNQVALATASEMYAVASTNQAFCGMSGDDVRVFSEK